MNSNRIRLVLGLDIQDGKFSEFQTIAQEMVALTMKEAGTLTYEFLLGADQKRCRLIETYNDVPAIAEHFKGAAVQQFLPQLLQVACLTALEFHGDPGPEIVAKAAQLNPAVFTIWQGFDR